MTNKQLVVVTGGSGFIASHIILQLLQQGYAVRTTVRNLDKRALINKMLHNGGLSDLSQLEVVAADLTHEEPWNSVMAAADYAIHVASPTPTLNFKNEDEMIRPAINGVLYVLRAASRNHVKRVVLTSAYGAIFAGHPNQTTPFTEEVWSDLSQPNIHPYQKSKTMAERAAWDFIANDTTGMELAAVNPVAVMGPVLSADFSHSNIQIQDLLNGKTKAVPRVDSGYVDVRDVAALHILAMTKPAAAGQRFLATTGETYSMLDVANILRTAFPAYAANLPTKTVPTPLLKLAAKANPMLRMVAQVADKYAETSNAKAVAMLDWHPRSAKEAIIATAQSMIDLGIVPQMH
ncbi:SDR family oxidoreductase [Lacticaseibacillus sharpeae]|uniref:NAD-dependent epimerase dehydratase n=1 Tax=Lacticaseibacillus sharpeae JCM 1186 = DSM 20505 TaxID=1291052 RepID=A0A0R1ZHY0_9LACO|nr:aldehyde reductase [Lacticaseibacillus sharpeae]KRM54471.1 NAD-dependent epimerase dehydratase [Lacticaseibacillus sharpeae JCM 1186 = DSM 20505]